MKRSNSFFLILLIIMSIGFELNASAISSSELINRPKNIPMNSTSGEITFPFGKNLHLDGNNYWNMTDLLDVNQTLDNLADFTTEGITAFSGDDVIPAVSANRHLVNVTLLNSTIWNDNDIGEGEIYFNVTINGNFTKTINYGANDGDTLDLNLAVFYAWCIVLDITVEVWEDDPAPQPDDELGIYHYATTNPVSQTITGNTTIGDAQVWLEIDVQDTTSGVTAEVLADGCKPYFYFTDETGATEEANETYARVLVGPDGDAGLTTAICIQYIFCWDKENFPFPINVQFHEDDYEQFLIFIDPSDLMHPYRYVFDDGSYISNTRSQRIAIWEDHATTAVLETEAFSSEELTPLIGDNYTAKYKYFNMSVVTDEFRMGTSGIQTMNLLVQTSFHNFQEGQPGIFDITTSELGFNYAIDELNDSKIAEFFRMHYYAFEQGLWWIAHLGLEYPKVHPFTFDVVNPFSFPYLINGYPNVVDDIDAFEEANSNFINYEYGIDLTLALLMKARYTITSPELVNPGDTFDATIEIEILEDDTEIALLYDLFLNGTIKALFFNQNFLFDHEGKVSVNIPIGKLSLLLSLLGYQPYEQSGLSIDSSGYLTMDHLYLAPNLLGTIMALNMTLDIWDMIKGELPGYYPATEKPLNLLDYFMESIELTLGAGFEGYNTGTISSNNTALATVGTDEFTFDGTTMSTTTEVTVAEDISTTTGFEIVLDDMLFTYEFFADWGLDINFGNIIALIAPQYAEMNFDIGTFPSIIVDSDDSLIDSDSTVTKTTTVTLDSITPTNTGGIIPTILTLLAISGLGTLVIIRKRKK